MPIFVFDKQTISETEWQPRADVYSTPTGWALKFDLAGVRPEDVKVEVQDMFLRVSGVRRDWIIERGWRHQSMEIAYSRFERVFQLPCDPTTCRVSIERQEGMLVVRIDDERKRKELDYE
ncbi:MAG TPA: Hsp20/alpha crystallin family protein [Acidobacteriota bacterium]|jgi:HSP20 family protein|nr:Hsp20/alpha crystallin family protein [Acidobacteriota bacterium]